jgi:hypothetical protein
MLESILMDDVQEIQHNYTILIQMYLYFWSLEVEFYIV